MPLSPDYPPRAVVAQLAPHAAGLTWHRAEPGFSGAVVWRGDDPAGVPQIALKGWPPGVPLERVQRVHAWLCEAERLPFVPRVLGPPVVAEGRCWDACRWMPGTPRAAPAADEVCAACVAVARLHACWPAETRGPCRGVAARIDVLNANRTQLNEWARGLPPVAPELDPLFRRAAAAVARRADASLAALRRWEARPLALRPCVRDLRGEHVLFEAGRVSGIIDFGAMIVDSPAVDLARLLGDYAGTDPGLLAVGLAAYGGAALLDAPDEFVHLLARTGAVCSALGWLVRVFVRREPVSRPGAITARLAELLARIEGDAHFPLSFQGFLAASE